MTVTFKKKTPRRDEGESMWISGERVFEEEGTAKFSSQSPELGGCLVCSKNRKETSVARLESRGMAIEEKVRGNGESIFWGFVGHYKDLGFIMSVTGGQWKVLNRGMA